MTDKQQENVEWELSELVDAIASELEDAQDKLSFKSYARGMSFGIKALNLDVEVKLRRTASGKLLFRTIDADDKTSGTILKLDFAQVLQSQLSDVRKPLDRQDSGGFGAAGVEILPQITQDEILKLDGISIHFVDELERYSQVPGMIPELSRLTGIAIHKLLMWQKLPFITPEIQLEKVSPVSRIAISGGNLGDIKGEVWLDDQKADIVNWNDTSVSVTMPKNISGVVLLSVKIGNRFTNSISFSVSSIQ